MNASAIFASSMSTVPRMFYESSKSDGTHFDVDWGYQGAGLAQFCDGFLRHGVFLKLKAALWCFMYQPLSRIS